MKVPHFFKPTKKKVTIFTVLVILGFIVFNFLTPKKQAPLQFTEVKRQDIRSIVSSSGNLTGKTIANLKFKSSGKLAYINVVAGDTVSKYQSIAGLDTQDLNITLQQAYNTLRDKEALKDKAEDDVKGHDEDETFAQKVTRTTAEVAKDNAYDNVKAAQKAITDAYIISPIAGIVTQAIQTPGQTVSTSDVIAQIVDITSIFFDTEVDEADISKIAVGQPAEITLDAYPGKIFKGVVNQILPQTKSTSSGASVVTVRIIMDNPEIVFVNGLSGEASIIYQTSLNTLTIPQEALRDDNTVIIQTNNKFEERKVEIGISSETDVEIKSGLSAREKALLSPPPPGAKLNK